MKMGAESTGCLQENRDSPCTCHVPPASFSCPKAHSHPKGRRRRSTGRKGGTFICVLWPCFPLPIRNVYLQEGKWPVTASLRELDLAQRPTVANLSFIARPPHKSGKYHSPTRQHWASARAGSWHRRAPQVQGNFLLPMPPSLSISPPLFIQKGSLALESQLATHKYR